DQVGEKPRGGAASKSGGGASGSLEKTTATAPSKILQEDAGSFASTIAADGSIGTSDGGASFRFSVAWSTASSDDITAQCSPDLSAVDSNNSNSETHVVTTKTKTQENVSAPPAARI
ncbi:unnamed protein product, partial [Amoebophrya sp. A25]